MKSWLKYLIFSILIFSLIFANRYVVENFMYLLNWTFKLQYFVFAMSISALAFIIMGVLLGLEKLLSERKKEGHWKVNLPKLILLGLPALYFSFVLVFAYENLVIYIPVRRLLLGGKHTWDFIPAVQVILGYTIITSFYKQKNEKLSVKDELDGSEVFWN